MAYRLWDPSLLEEEWFLDLPDSLRWLYIWGLGHSTQAGVWNPNKQFVLKHHYVRSDKIDFAEFVRRVNTAEDGSTIIRVKLLANGSLFFVGSFVQQLGKYFKPTVNAHRGALKVLLENNIPLTEITGFQWRGLEESPYSFQFFVANDKSILNYTEGVAMRWVRETRNMTDETVYKIIETIKSGAKFENTEFSQAKPDKKAKGREEGSGSNGMAGMAEPEAPPPPPPPPEAPPAPQEPAPELTDSQKIVADFFGDKMIQTGFNSRKTKHYHSVAEVYRWKYEDLFQVPSYYKKYTEQGFILWKDFVDYVIASNMLILLNPEHFLSVSDMCQLIALGITREKWNTLMTAMTMQKIHFNDNLFFLIQSIAKSPAGQTNASTQKPKYARGGSNGTGDNTVGQDYNKMNDAISL